MSPLSAQANVALMGVELWLSRLPVNLHQLPREKQCNYVKKAHKALARKWHPDKAKGNKERASRKMNEVSEAKEKLVAELQC